MKDAPTNVVPDNAVLCTEDMLGRDQTPTASGREGRDDRNRGVLTELTMSGLARTTALRVCSL